MSQNFTKLKGATDIDSSILVSITDLANLKCEVDDLDVDKPKTVPADLSQLSNVVDNDIDKKNMYRKLVTRVNYVDTKLPRTCGLVPKTQYN